MAILSIGAVILAVFATLLGLGVVAGGLWVLWKLLRAIFWLLARVLGFVRREFVDALHAVGALVTACATVPLMAVNLMILRLGAARHYGQAFLDELGGVGIGVWRVALGNPLRLLGLGALVDGVESRLPDAMERAPRTRRARRATFEGYDVVGTLPSGGSGAQLFVARPKSATHQRFLKAGRALPAEVVIKSFALEAGSTLPQIVRESRALEAASRLGLVCEHQLTNDHFFYVMPYVKGEDLERVTRALHARGTAEGLAEPELRLALGYGIDLLDSLQRFHSGGLWHKDVKPSNIIVASGRAHLVDFGLVTPLASAMTLTTHGTEYYRDPEMVRLAMQGVKVHEVDGVRFDVYSAGAVLHTLIEGSFPAHGSLSRLSRRAPEALRWVVQRAMAELGSRYPSAAEMRADLAVLAAAVDPFALRPADLPSFPRALEPDVPARVFPPFDLPATRAALRTPDPLVPAAIPASRRGRRKASVAALSGLAALFFFSSLAFLVARPPPAFHEARAFEARPVSAPVSARDWKHLTAGERELIGLAQGVVEDLGARSVEEPMADLAPQSELPEVSTVASVATEPDALGSPAGWLPAGGRVLVLDDLTTSADQRVLARLQVRLAERGFAVVGQVPETAGAAEAIEALASARHALGLGRAEEPETQARLQSYLDGSDLDALILVSRAAEESEHVYRVFVHEERTRAGTED